MIRIEVMEQGKHRWNAVVHHNGTMIATIEDVTYKETMNAAVAVADRAIKGKQ